MQLGEQVVILLIKEKYHVKHIQSNGADSLYNDCPYIEQTLQNHLMFLCFVDVICYLQHCSD